MIVSKELGTSAVPPKTDGANSSLPDKKVEQKRTSLLTSISPLVFPSDLRDEFYIEFNAFSCNQDRPQEAKRTFSFEKSIYLPFPATLTDQYGASYSREDLFFGGEFMKNSLDSLMTTNGTKSVSNLFGNGVADRAGNIAADVANRIGQSPTQAAAAAGTYLLTGVGGPIGAAAKAAFNVTTNPYPVMIYQGTGFKSFGFSWTFYPESKQETDVIKKIIGYFRREMLPERVENMPSILKYPAIFEVSVQPELKQFKRCVITNIDVNYTAAGGPAFVKEFPVKSSDFIEAAAISLTIQMQEIEIWLANDFYPDEGNDFDFIKTKRRRRA